MHRPIWHHILRHCKNKKSQVISRLKRRDIKERPLAARLELQQQQQHQHQQLLVLMTGKWVWLNLYGGKLLAGHAPFSQLLLPSLPPSLLFRWMRVYTGGEANVCSALRLRWSLLWKLDQLHVKNLNVQPLVVVLSYSSVELSCLVVLLSWFCGKILVLHFIVYQARDPNPGTHEPPPGLF